VDVAKFDTSGDPGGDATARFLLYRDALFGVSYRILGRYADAEDVVQEAWLRWADADHASINDPRAWLITATTRLSIDRLRRAQRRKESYVGQWLPEPVVTTPDVAEDVTAAETVSLAMLVVLEALSPLERAVFVLREAFGYTHAEIAQILGRGEPAVRQLARRARAHVDARATRYEHDQRSARKITERFLSACTGGDVDTLLGLLAPGVTLVGDGGGVAKAPPRVLQGADKVARFLLAVASEPIPDLRIGVRDVNGAPAIVVASGDEPLTLFAFDLLEGRIHNISLVANPTKLAGIRAAGSTTDFGPPWPLSN
jgi:RNA polymerase sigma-70 factor, ECF subfamily